MLHAKGLIDVIDLWRKSAIGDFEQIDIIGFHQCIDLAEVRRSLRSQDQAS